MTETRIHEYLAYHQESARAGDIDPSYAMLRYVCDRFELTVEQRYWLAFVYAMTYCGASTYYVYNEFPDFENVDVGRMNRWWHPNGRLNIICQTDRRWVRSSSLFVPAVESYQRWIGGKTQHEHFMSIATGATPEERYNKLYKSASKLHSFGQFALFLYLEALHTITPLELVPTDLDLNQAWSCRNGLLYAYGLDEFLTEAEEPMPAGAKGPVAEAWADVRERIHGLVLPAQPTVWQIETTLCAYKKFHRGKRYLGYYVDRQALEIAKMENNVKDGVAWDVLWQFRDETYTDKSYLVEKTEPSERLAKKGLSDNWKQLRNVKTTILLAEAAQ
ncbi:hypothetical protein UFOVP1196_18 [uncultured Caudovirales phage]|uniref:Amino acid:DNA transferase domain-containing protein n=1 Tax=uncultured Caudovirales phage TaxID=2100421 RepID=A0A6J5QZQ8_9CAUD|nr:hypothetical protein UFOVP1196_18 [uncultured Caudovirales phage]